MPNEDSKRKNKNKKKKKSFLDILIITLTVILIFLITTILVAMTFETPIFSKADKSQVVDNKENDLNKEKDKDSEKDNKEEKYSDVPEENKTNFAVFGVDKDGVRTDVIFVVSFDKSLKTVSVVSVPRDTRVQMTDEILKGLKERNRNIPVLNGVKGVCKLNEVHAYAGDGFRNQYSVMQLEDLLGIKIDYFAKINTEGFRDIVDAVGGVDIDVKERLYYNDPVQELYIDLQTGITALRWR